MSVIVREKLASCLKDWKKYFGIYANQFLFAYYLVRILAFIMIKQNRLSFIVALKLLFQKNALAISEIIAN